MKRAVLLCVLCLVPVLALCAVAPAWAFMSTGDGGWFWQNPLPQGNILRAVDFVDATHGWAVGDSGTIVATSDGGATWSVQSSGTTNDLHGVGFVDASHGWAVGSGSYPYSNVILATSDGGAHWNTQRSGTGMWLTGVDFVDGSHGWVVGGSGAGGVILATTDGGTTWNSQSLPPVSGASYTELKGVCFVDANQGWAVGDGFNPPDSPKDFSLSGYGLIFATSDGGVHWHVQSSVIDSGFNAVTFPDASHGWAVGYGPTSSGLYTNVIQATTDGGSHWNAESSGTSDWLYGVSFVDASNGWAVGDGGILATSDGGTTWTTQDPGLHADLSSVDFFDASHGWAVGSGGTILATTTGGVSVDTIPPTTTVSGADDLWHSSDVNLTFTATGVAYTEFKIGSGDWTKGTSVTVPAPADHSGDGIHTVSYYSVDNAGNTEATQSVTVKIDTTKPVIRTAYVGFLRHSANTSRCNRRSHFGLTYRIDDNLSPTVAVTLEALDSRGKVVRTISLGQCPTGVQQTCGLPCKLWLCHWRVTATDLAGNAQSKIAGFRL
jgi:photosystem II stability/assembly factor-like uncharacterized protein